MLIAPQLKELEKIALGLDADYRPLKTFAVSYTDTDCAYTPELIALMAKKNGEELVSPNERKALGLAAIGVLKHVQDHVKPDPHIEMMQKDLAALKTMQALMHDFKMGLYAARSNEPLSRAVLKTLEDAFMAFTRTTGPLTVKSGPVLNKTSWGVITRSFPAYIASFLTTKSIALDGDTRVNFQELVEQGITKLEQTLGQQRDPLEVLRTAIIKSPDQSKLLAQLNYHKVSLYDARIDRALKGGDGGRVRAANGES